MTTVLPQALVHCGAVDASGFLFPTELIGEEEARRRCLRLWTPGATVYRLEAGLLLHLSGPVRVECEGAPGTVLVQQRGCLVSAPLQPEEWKAVDAPAGMLLLVSGGAVDVQPLTSQHRENPAAWLNVQEWRTAPTRSLGSAPAAPRPVVETLPFDPRSRLPGVPPESPERAIALAAIRNPKANASAASGGFASTPLGKWLFKLAESEVRPEMQGTARPGESLGDKLRWQIARMLQAARLSEVIGRRQAEYLGRTMEMFDRGDLREALRHAIPLSMLEGIPKPPALRVPKPRADLTLTMQPKPVAASAYNLDHEFFEHLRTLYRQAYEKLEREGRIEEAAFVLTELLGKHAEAVAFLERHNRLRLAAELAEGHKMPADLVVRLWFLAGEQERAIRLARRWGAFYGAIERLEGTDPQRARDLRLLWVVREAEAGNYVDAIYALRPLLFDLATDPEFGPRVCSWLDRAILVGGSAGGYALAWKLDAFPQMSEADYARAIALLEDESPESGLQRSAFRDMLSTMQPTPRVKVLARYAARSFLRDAAPLSYGHTRMDTDYRALIDRAEDAALRVDLPALSREEEEWAPPDMYIAADDRGLLPIYDAGFLPNGTCIVALGEMGVRLLTSEGRTAAHFDAPAHRLVLSYRGDRAIALAARGELWTLTLLDLSARKAEPWCEAALTAFASDFDGSLWFVAIADTFLALDMTSRDFEALWRLPGLEGRVVQIALGESECSFLLEKVSVRVTQASPSAAPAPTLIQTVECWRHSLPDLYLRDRGEMFSPALGVLGVDYTRAINPGGEMIYLTANQGGENSLFGKYELGGFWVSGPPKGERTGSRFVVESYEDRPIPLPPVLAYAILAFARHARGVDGFLMGWEWEDQWRLTLEGAQRASARYVGDWLTLWDDLGRLLVLDRTTLRLIRNLRLR